MMAQENTMFSAHVVGGGAKFLGCGRIESQESSCHTAASLVSPHTLGGQRSFFLGYEMTIGLVRNSNETTARAAPEHMLVLKCNRVNPTLSTRNYRAVLHAKRANQDLFAHARQHPPPTQDHAKTPHITNTPMHMSTHTTRKPFYSPNTPTLPLLLVCTHQPLIILTTKNTAACTA